MTRYTIDAQRRWIAVVRRGAVLMLPTPDPAAVDDLWEALGAAEPTAAVLARLTRTGLADLAPFALAVPDARGMRVVVRGGFRVRVAGEAVTGAEVSTWVERSFPGIDAVEVLAPFAARAADDRGWPVVDGVVPAAVVLVGAAAEGEPATASAAAPAALPTAGPAEEPGTPAPAAAPVPEATPVAEMTVVPEATVIPETTAIPEATVIPDATVIPEATVVPDDTILVSREASAVDAVEDRTIVVDRAARSTAPTPAGVGLAGDHDGRTIVVEDLQRLRREAAAAARPPQPKSQPASASNPAPSSQGVRLRLPDGTEEALAGDVVLGRSPSVGRTSGTRLPRLVTIGVGDPDISRSHVRIGLEGGTVVVTDLHSRNGTQVVQPGRPPVKLRGGEPTPVLAGTVVDLGGGCVIAVVEA
ncbi:FHA domain-containing protein [Agromyces sp. MMS24-JH15]|uniref:FHA domain-containing protein n=1 Tax=Agromyces sp. MMS24-JH15 TaxID=3243765 RepID=UPI00374A1CF8